MIDLPSSWSNAVSFLFGQKRDGKSADARESLPPLTEQFLAGSRKRASSAVSFPHFRATASDRRIELPDGDVHAQTRMRFLEAFTPSQPISDRKRFAGRVELLTSLIRAIEEKRLHVILYGPRGLGKTSALHVLAQAARDARYLVVYLSCGADSNFDDVFRTVAASIPMLFYSAVGLTSPEVEKGKTLADILPSEPISPRLASDLLARIVGTRVVVLLDEFDRSGDQVFRRDVAELIKNLSDRRVRVQLIIAGVATDLVELLEHSPSIQRSIYPLQVPRMTAEEIKILIRNGQDLSGVRFADAAIQIIIKAAHGSPYLASLVSHHAGICALEAARADVTAADAVAGTTAAMQEIKNRLSSRATAPIANLVQEKYVRGIGAMAGCAVIYGGSFSARDLRATSVGVDIAERCNELIPLLAAEGLLLVEENKDAKSYRFPDDNLTHYLWLMSVDAELRERRPPGAIADGAGQSIALTK